MRPSRVAVVGAGIAGLTAANELQRLDPGIDVVVLEAGPRVGGKILTTAVGDLVVDGGPDSFLNRVPWARDLVAELGLADEIVHPATSSAYLWLDGDLRPVPPGSVLGVPLDLDALAATGLVSPAGVERARLDLTRPGLPLIGDVAVGSLVRDRLGDEVFERLVEPLLGGINAGNADELSVRAGAPQLAAAAEQGGSLLTALREQRDQAVAATGGPAPVFFSLRGGVGRIAEALADRLGPAIVLDRPVERVEPVRGAGYRLHTPTGPLEADGVVVATPAHTAAAQLGDLPEVGGALAAIEFASVAVVILVVDVDELPRPLDASGFLVPRTRELLLTACSWGSAKWPHWAPPDRAVLRASVGRIDDERHLHLDDDDLTDAVRADLATTMGLTATPVAARVVRWPRSLPQYPPGHLERAAALDAALAVAAPGLVLAGASYHGIGMPACILQARDAARRLLDQLDH